MPQDDSEADLPRPLLPFARYNFETQPTRPQQEYARIFITGWSAYVPGRDRSRKVRIDGNAPTAKQGSWSGKLPRRVARVRCTVNPKPWQQLPLGYQNEGLLTLLASNASLRPGKVATYRCDARFRKLPAIGFVLDRIVQILCSVRRHSSHPCRRWVDLTLKLPAYRSALALAVPLISHAVALQSKL